MILNVRLLKMKLNDNSENFFKWIFRRNDKLNSVVFLFISRINANNARFSPLFQSTQKIRIIYFPGLPIKYTDQILSRIFTNLQKLLYSKIALYQSIHIFGTDLDFHNQIQILHIDDPTYSVDEIEQILSWHTHLKNNLAIIICSNKYTEKIYKSAIPNIKILIIEQGFHDVQLLNHKFPLTNFSCVYSSPYIHYGLDLHGADSSWGSSEVIDNIIPLLNNNIPDAQIHLVGEIGKHAREKWKKCKNIYLYGRVDQTTNLEILKKCSH